MSDLTPTNKVVYQDIKRRAERAGKKVTVKKGCGGWADWWEISVDGKVVCRTMTDPR